ncbi:tryptophan synthase subunit alpha [Bacillus lacus]|uniref:Tryptophan synthase alpha chain n=1 Tax=Metabacillus lacus TaxID=1983721 RepID=A0A7X2IWD7_9BACI|nr:tryptophan synthase subunit alpha [Metabacillus lacus]MRX70991.1 tryptophan synthase subunit alpha [Metabacillus lacus]
MESLQKLQQSGEKLFIPFITAGDPSLQASADLALALQEAGASAIELGVPYSDPLADGPVIQRASVRALSSGVTIKKVMEMVPELRKKGVTIPIILFTYYNPVLQLGEEYFFALMRKNTINGLLIPDLPYEENRYLKKQCKENGISLISLVAPTSSDRIKKITEEAEGFLYCISSLGITGERQGFEEEAYTFIKEVKHMSPVPVAVGFGISSRQQAEEMNKVSDGIIVGSALVRKIESLREQLQNPETYDRALAEFKMFASEFKTT